MPIGKTFYKFGHMTVSDFYLKLFVSDNIIANARSVSKINSFFHVAFSCFPLETWPVVKKGDQNESFCPPAF